MKIEIVPLYNFSQDGVTSTMLILNENVYILLDCGLCRNFDVSIYQRHQELLRKTQVILLSHSGLEYCGALYFLLEEFQISPQIFATSPIEKFGKLSLFDAFINHVLISTTQYDMQQIFKKLCQSFERIQVLQFQQKKLAKVHSL